MRMQTSACVVLAWALLAPVIVITGLTRPAHLAPASARTPSTPSTTSTTSTTSTHSGTSTRRPSAASAPVPIPPTRTPTTSTPAPPAPPATTSTTSTTSTTRTRAIPARPATLATTVAIEDAPLARYVVQPGDTLTGIAARLDLSGGWAALYAANRAMIGPDPGTITPGTVLILPGPRAPARYTITPGDTLTRIAAQFAVPGGWPAL